MEQTAATKQSAMGQATDGVEQQPTMGQAAAAKQSAMEQAAATTTTVSYGAGNSDEKVS